MFGRASNFGDAGKKSLISVILSGINNSYILQLRQNQRISARIAFEKKENVLMVKRGAFMGSLGGKFAYKVIDDN